ncbi:hypothetical protein GGX14DRAFT_589315, partial [Mycena pura]
RNFIQTHPNAFHVSASSLSALIGIGSAPSFIPLIFTVAVLLLYAPILFHRPHRVRYTALLWFSISLCSSVARLAPTLSALSTVGPSIAVLLAMSGFTSALAIFAIFLDVFVSTRYGTPQAILFPSIWTTLWVLTSHMSLGRLTAWSPVLGTQSYQWLAPWTGPAGIDWVVAAWAVVISQGIGNWYMGNLDYEIPTTGVSRRSSGNSAWFLVALLTTLTIPTTVFSGTPHPVNPFETATPFDVGCALPPFWKYKDASPALEDYITESKSLNHAKVVLWPEGAVSFPSESERDAGFDYIRQSIPASGTYWAVSFEEHVLRPSDNTSLSRTGIALLSNHSSETHMVYYKRSLVPIAESFHLTPGILPPPTYELPLGAPKHIGKPKWAPGSSDFTRPIKLTASICLDFALPSPFRDLDSRPALILAPARTWDHSIGRRMWEEVKQRANEIGSLALWCDGGMGGISGVAGAGYNEVYQVGEGSWSRTVGIPYPFDSTRTFYARFGDTPTIAASWFFVLGPTAFLMALSRSPLHALTIKCVRWVAKKKDKLSSAGTAEQPNLIVFREVSSKMGVVPVMDIPATRLPEPFPRHANTVCFWVKASDTPFVPCSPVLPSRPARSLPGPARSTRSNRPAPRKPLISTALGSFEFITSDDLPIRLDSSPQLQSASLSTGHSSPPAAPKRSPYASSPSRHKSSSKTFALLRRLRAFAKAHLRRPPRHRPLTDDPHPPLNTLRQTTEPAKARKRDTRFVDHVSSPVVYQRVYPSELTASASSFFVEAEPPPSAQISAHPPPPTRETDKPTQTSERDCSLTLHSPLSPLDVSSARLHQLEPPAFSFQLSESEPSPVLKTGFHPTAKPPLTTSINASNLPNLETERTYAEGSHPLDMDYTGKQGAEVVDFGGEIDYSNYRWFEDPPAKQPPAQSVGTPYVPLPGVIEQNEAFEFALSAAPNVLYARYKQYGQLGVLAWCSEFSELIDNLKELGFVGNMFVTTRTQALRTCEEVLKLMKHTLDLKMQIIVMYLSSQVARLRRFLDGDKTWEDYPEPQFP